MTSCRNWVSRNTDPNIPKDIASEAVFAAAKARLRKKRIGSIGVGLRSSQAMNPISAVIPKPAAPMISGLSQPALFPRTSAQTIPSSPALARPMPGRSMFLLGP